ncbi:hypothetical protein [Aliamphritea hakodatensis]|uniref:hypothetical protein n=1 Tax=Aliamphritea hakodatensis TaxID=2895352 RepID=UPI0022FDAB5A|nr:hypothetical protein [Aliamphritea hakodatensis]
MINAYQQNVLISGPEVQEDTATISRQGRIEALASQVLNGEPLSYFDAEHKRCSLNESAVIERFMENTLSGGNDTLEEDMKALKAGVWAIKSARLGLQADLTRLMKQAAVQLVDEHYESILQELELLSDFLGRDYAA